MTIRDSFFSDHESILPGSAPVTSDISNTSPYTQIDLLSAALEAYLYFILAEETYVSWGEDSSTVASNLGADSTRGLFKAGAYVIPIRNFTGNIGFAPTGGSDVTDGLIYFYSSV